MTEVEIGDDEGPVGGAAAGRVSDERSEESARQALSRRFPVIRDRLRESRLPAMERREKIGDPAKAESPTHFGSVGGNQPHRQVH